MKRHRMNNPVSKRNRIGQGRKNAWARKQLHGGSIVHGRGSAWTQKQRHAA